MDMKVLVGGRFKLEAVKPDGSRRLLADWFDNLVTDTGLDLIGTSSAYLNCCQVGTGSTAANASDTALETFVIGTTTASSGTTGNGGSPPYYNYKRRVYTFGIGTVVGNMSEVGIGPQATTGNLYSRALIVDGGGSPTTVTVFVTEQLEVTYEARFYLPASDVPFTLTANSIERTGNVRAAHAADTSGWGISIGSMAQISSNSIFAYTGSIGAITSGPSGTSVINGSGTAVQDAYSSSSHQRTGVVSFNTAQANHASGIGAITFSTVFGSFQMGFSPALEKDATMTLAFSFTLSWARYT